MVRIHQGASDRERFLSHPHPLTGIFLPRPINAGLVDASNLGASADPCQMVNRWGLEPHDLSWLMDDACWNRTGNTQKGLDQAGHSGIDQPAGDLDLVDASGIEGESPRQFV